MSREISIHTILMLFTLMLFMIGGASAGTVEVSPLSPNNNTVVDNDTLDINATALDPDENNVTNMTYNLTYNDPQGPETVETYTGFNDTLDVETDNLESGNYDLVFYVKDNQSDVNTSLVNFTLHTGGEGPGGEEGLEIDDGKKKTRDVESPNIAYLGSDLSIEGGNISTTYNLTVGDTTIADNINVTDTVSTSSSDPEGRAILKDENNPDNNVTVDLVNDNSDLTGRIINGTFGSRTVSGVGISYWINGSNASSEILNTKINESWSTDDALFRMNVSSSISQFWLNVTTSDGSKFVTSRAAQAWKPDVSMPRVNDVTVSDKSNITGKVKDNDTNSDVADLKLRLRRMPAGLGSFFPSRQPKETVPPTKTTYTNSSGKYEFTGLQPGDNYIVDVTNYSWARTNYSAPLFSEGGDVSQISPGVSKTNDFNVTDDTGNASLKMLGEQNSNTKYGFIISRFTDEGSQSYMKPNVDPGVEQLIGVPAGNYSITAAKFVTSGGFFPSILTDFSTVEVENDTTSSTKELGFPSLVYLNGSVNKSSGGAVEDALVFAENQSEGEFYVGRTDSNGDYSIKVRNQTNYTVKVEPGFGSALETKNKTNREVSGQTTVNFTLSTGPYIEGYYNVSGSGVEGVEIYAWNGSEDSRGFAETDSDGYYRIGGLKNDTNHTLYVETPPGYSSDQASDVTALESGTWKDFTFGSKEQYDINGTINSSSSGERLDATVNLRPLESGTRDQNITENGSYGFAQVNSGDYKVVVDPDNESYTVKTEKISLSGDETLNFTLEELNEVSGYVNAKNTANNISNVLVKAYNYSSESFETDRTDSDGYYSLEVKNVSHKVELWPGEDSSYQFNRTSFDQSDVGGEKNFELESGVYLDGQVKEPGVKNLSGYINVWNDSKGISRYQEFGDDGKFNVTGLNKSVGYNIYVETDNSSYASNRTNITSSSVPGTLDFNFTQKKGPEVWITVKSDTGGTVTNATVTLSGNQKTTGSEGKVKYGEQVDKNTLTVSATKENYNATTKNFTAKTNYSSDGGQASREIQNETLTVEYIQGELKDVSINVTDSDNEPVSNAVVVARSNSSSRTVSAITNSEGNATLQQIEPGNDIQYLTAVSANGNFNSENVTLNAGTSNQKDIGSDFDLGYEVPN